MMSKSEKKYQINPSLGLLPSILYLVLFTSTHDIAYSLIISIICSGLADFSLRVYTKSSVSSFVFLINLCALTITLIVWFFLKDLNISNLLYLVFYKVLFVSLILIARLSKTFLTLYIGKSMVQKTYLSESFEVLRLTQYGLTLYLFTLLIFNFLQEISEPLEFWKRLFYFFIPLGVLVSIIFYEELKRRDVLSYFRKEEWLPIVNESGEVIGRVAKSVSDEMKNRFLHPVVRIALIHNGELYLQKRSVNERIAPCTYDHPFEKYMLFNHEINIAARNSISYALDMQELPFNFLLKYVYENEDTKRLIFLFVSRVETEDQLKSLRLLKGKFWTVKQIEDSFSDDDLFSECFQLEYEYLKNTVLQPELLQK